MLHANVPTTYPATVDRPPSVAGSRPARDSVPVGPPVAACGCSHAVHRGMSGTWVACVTKAGHRGWTAYRIWGIGTHAGTWGAWWACGANCPVGAPAVALYRLSTR